MTTITFSEFMLISSLVGLVESALIGWGIAIVRRAIINRRRRLAAKRKYA